MIQHEHITQTESIDQSDSNGEPLFWQTFAGLLVRLTSLEIWRELAVRPTLHCPDDLDLVPDNDCDDIFLLTRRCSLVRKLLNENLPSHDTGIERDLVPKKSTIEGAGKGLFFCPADTEQGTGRKFLPTGATACFYWGHIHNYRSAAALDDISYLMSVSGDVLVDPGPLPHVKARYINDPMDDEAVNCVYTPDVGSYRCRIVATRDIYPGEELFGSYGDGYWSQQPFSGNGLTKKFDGQN